MNRGAMSQKTPGVRKHLWQYGYDNMAFVPAAQIHEKTLMASKHPGSGGSKVACRRLTLVQFM
jgi:hypothetical protein